MTDLQQVSLLRNKEVSLPMGTTKNSREITPDVADGVIQGAGYGLVAGGLITWLTSLGISGGDPTAMLLSFSSISPMVIAPLFVMGSGTGFSLARYFETKSNLKSIAPGFTFRRGLSIAAVLPSFKENRDIVYLESQFDRPAKEVAIIRNRGKLYVEYLTQRPAGDVWDDSMKSLKAVYGIQPKSTQVLQKTEETQSTKKIHSGSLSAIHALREKAKNQWNRKRV